MRTIKHWALAAAAAAALALAGCGGGGGSSSTAPTTPTEPPPPSALSFATDLNGSVAALMTLSGDADAEGSALMMAMKYAGMIGTLKSDGNSMAAMMSAQMVLDARQALMNAIEAAEADKMEAEAAKADTEDADVLAALDDAIEAAEEAIEAAEEVLDGDDLAGYVEMVTGDDEDDLKTAADKGEEVAMAVAMALGPTTNTNGAGLRVTHGTAAPDLSGTAHLVSEKANQFSDNDATGMTFAMIVGEDDLTDMRVNTGVTAPAVTRTVMAKSVDGMKTADLFSTVPGTIGTADGTEIDTDVVYKGIPGLLFCAGSDCKVEGTGDAQKLTGSWYLTADNAKAFFTKGEDGTYSEQTLYATFGHWLAVDDGSDTAANAGQVTVYTFANRADGGTDTGSWAAADPASTDAGLRASSATYEGMAVGRSVHKTLDSDGDITDIQSGRFTASVTLNAAFAATGSTLGGTIDKFVGVDNPYAVDSTWTVKLNAATTSDGSVAAGVTEATGQNGTWSSASYGAATGRPVGIYGGFNAHFSDGHAAGAYATRQKKD